MRQLSSRGQLVQPRAHAQRGRLALHPDLTLGLTLAPTLGLTLALLPSRPQPSPSPFTPHMSPFTLAITQVCSSL